MMSIGLLRPSRKSLFDKWVTAVTQAVPELAGKNLKAFSEAADYGTPLELFQYNPEATEIINATRDSTIRTNSVTDVRAAFTDAAQKVNDAEQKAAKSARIFVKPSCGCTVG